MPSFVLALISGALLALSFPRFGTPAFAWLALAPLLVALGRPARASRGFQLGLTAGIAYFGGTVYWVSGVMAQYGGFGAPLAVLIAALLVVFLALFPAIFGAVLVVFVSRLGRRALLAAPAVWVATELGRTLFGGGFPWALVGYTQVPVLPVAQFASLVGVYGLSALVVAFNAAVAYASLERGREGWRPAVVALTVVAGIAIWGQARLRQGHLLRAGSPLTVGLVQGNIPQDLKWDPHLEDEILDKYLTHTREAIRRGARLVLWPESATPFYFEEHVKGERIRQLARDERAWLLIGSDQLERRVPPVSYNAAFLVGPDGRTRGVYRKVHLVPFGEYVPLRRLLFFAAPLVENVSDFMPGTDVATLPFANGSRLEYRDLLRGGVPCAHPRRRPAGKRAADDDHQRRVVRAVVRPMAALRHGLAPGDRAGALPCTRGQHRGERVRRPVRARARPLFAVHRRSARARGPAHRRTYLVCAARRRRRLGLRRGHRAGAGGRARRARPIVEGASAERLTNVSLATDELVRRYQELAPRAAGLRGYL